MKHILLIVAALLAGQTPPGVIRPTRDLAVTAGVLRCSFSDQNKPAVHTICLLNDQNILTEDATPAPGAKVGYAGTLRFEANAITWQFHQPTPGILTWQITANGVQSNGTF